MSGIAVYGLSPAQDQVRKGIHPGNRACNHLGGGQGVCTGKVSVRQQNRLVGSCSHGLPQRFFTLGRPHGENRDRASLFLLQIQRCLESNAVKRIDDALHPVPNDGHPLPVDTNVGSIRNLFYAHDDVHKQSLTVLCSPFTVKAKPKVHHSRFKVHSAWVARTNEIARLWRVYP